MHDARLFTGRTKSGGHKAFVIGRVDKFSNERKITVEGQPHRGFERRDQAASHALNIIPTAEALATWASKTGDGEFISNEKKKDLALEEVAFPGAQPAPAPTGPVMPLADQVPARGRAKPPPAGDSEEQITEDATRQLAADPSLAGRLATSVDVVKRTKALQRTKEAEAARQRMGGGPLDLDDAQLEQAIRTFANAGELLIQFLRHTARIELLMKERATIWECLLREFKTPELASAMVERARAVVSAWVQDAQPASPPA
jgi:hypothetical protein